MRHGVALVLGYDAHAMTSDRRIGEPASGAPEDARSPARGVAYAVMAALLGAIGIVILGGGLAVSAGLLMVAAVTGWGVGIAIVAGAGERLARSTRRVLAVVIAVDAVVVAQLGLWLVALAEGGVLDLPAYLAQTFGILVPAQVVLAAGAAWWRAR
jgi:hypothetical protein